MESIQTRLALASQRAAGQRSFQILGDHDLPRLDAFFLSFDFDQRRGYFGGGISSQSIRKFCRSIDWNVTTVIARSGPCCLGATAALVSLPRITRPSNFRSPARSPASSSLSSPSFSNSRSARSEIE